MSPEGTTVFVVHSVFLDGEFYARCDFVGACADRETAVAVAEQACATIPEHRILFGSQKDLREGDSMPHALITETRLLGK